MTPEFEPVWWRPTSGSRSSTVTRKRGCRVSSSGDGEPEDAAADDDQVLVATVRPFYGRC